MDPVRVLAGDSHPVFIGFDVDDASPPTVPSPSGGAAQKSPLSAALEARPMQEAPDRPPSARGFRSRSCRPWWHLAEHGGLDVPPRVMHCG